MDSFQRLANIAAILGELRQPRHFLGDNKATLLEGLFDQLLYANHDLRKLENPEVCPKCMGDMTAIANLKEKPDGTFEGDLIDCPECEGTGRADR